MDKSDTTSAASEENSPRESPKPAADRKKKRPQLKRTIAKVLDEDPDIDMTKLPGADT